MVYIYAYSSISCDNLKIKEQLAKNLRCFHGVHNFKSLFTVPVVFEKFERLYLQAG
jgi:hypothetical protein